MLHQVITTEKVPITFRVAGMGSRFLAWLIDSGCTAILAFAGIVFATSLESVEQGTGIALAILWSFVAMWGYYLLFEWLWFGQTPGKRLMGIRVIQLRGTSITFTQSAVRNIVRFADGLPWFSWPGTYAVGFVVAALSPKHRRLGDVFAGTLVVHVDRKVRAVQPIPDLGVNGVDVERESVARQRIAQLDRQQQQALLDLCLRRDQLPKRERIQLFHEAAAFFESRLGLPREERQSDEKYVIRVASLLSPRPPREEAATRSAKVEAGV
jgi:uncharacterized RDD family membrane protein YckC